MSSFVHLAICIVTAEPRDIDVQYMSQKEKLTIDPVFGTISVENKDTSTLLQSVSVVISSTLAKCRTPSFSRILTQTTTTITPVTSEHPLDQTESVDGVTSTIDGISNGTLTDPAQEIQDLYEDLPPLSRRRRGWFEEFIVDDPTGVAQINSILKFILSTDFGNHYYDGHFLSDLIAGLAVIEDWESYPISKDVISRSVFFTSGLGFIYPAKLHGFEEDLTADFANSSLWQRVLDSDGLLFWIQPKMEVAGLTLKETYLQSRLTEFPECSGEKVCYLLDDAALILAANKPALNYQVGHFLGSADPWLMQELLDNMVYSRVKYYDYQSVCDTTELADRNCTSPGAAGHAGRGDYMSCIKSSYRYYATDGAIFVTSSRASSNAFTSMLMENLMQDAAEIPIAGNETEYFDELPLPPEVPVRPVTSGVFNCSESCTRFWSATPIPETNTKLVVVDPVCPCAPNDVEWHLSPSIAKDITVCEDMQNPRYRRPVQTCTPS
ncbi:unnamed protein product [Schistocephalus solidus]|uniref:VGCC_alpha2 domain-containing protein n=1 Tax=Schistocephalus solidus TaxID=70667 RepID=A0A183SE62_SCHSO|nr:unnamed protein product [Schistocephalus solidus]